MRLRANAVQLLEENLALSMDNSGAHGACAAGAGKEATEETDADAETQACVDVQGKWRFEGQRLLIDFQGQIRDIKNGKPQATRPVRERAVYELQADGLKLVEGTNPVPDF